MHEASGDEFDEDLAPAKSRTTRQKRGGKVTETTVTKRELVDDDSGTEDEPKQDDTFAGIFDAGDANKGIIEKIRVYRIDPHEGFLDYISDMGAQPEKYIKEHWGGSTYRLEAVNARGRLVRVRNLRVSGDPIFVGEAEEAAYRKAKGLAPKNALGLPAAPGMTPQEVLDLVKQTERERREDEEKRADQRRKEDERLDEKRRKEEREWREQQARDQRDFDERRRKDELDREDRRRKDEVERDERRRREQAEGEARRQDHMQQMLMMVKQSSEQALTFMKATAGVQTAQANPTAQLVETVKAIALVRDAFGGNGEAADVDPLTMLMKSLPDMISGIGPAIGATIREVRGQPAAQPAAGMSLPPAIGSKMEQLATLLAARGVDPEKGIEAMLSNAAEKLAAQANTQQNAIAAVPQQPSVVRSDAKEVTAPPASAAPVPRARIPGPAPTKTPGGATYMRFQAPA